MSRAWGGLSATQLRVWDMRVVFVEKQQRWWWNAWRSATATELYGFADSEQDARQAMCEAVEKVPDPITAPAWSSDAPSAEQL